MASTTAGADGSAEAPARKRRRRRRRKKRKPEQPAAEAGASVKGEDDATPSDEPPVKALEDAGPAPKSMEGDEDTASAEPSQEAAPPSGEREKSKRRRRRKKRTDSAGSPEAAGDAQSTDAKPADATSDDGDAETKAAEKNAEKKAEKNAEKDEDRAPTGAFAEFLPKTEGGRRHAFSTGSIVAGRVETIVDEVIVLDLFGKGLAVMELHEPRSPGGAVGTASVAPEGEKELAADRRREGALAGALARGELFAIAWDQPVDADAAERRRRLVAVAAANAGETSQDGEHADAVAESVDATASAEASGAEASEPEVSASAEASAADEETAEAAVQAEETAEADAAGTDAAETSSEAAGTDAAETSSEAGAEADEVAAEAKSPESEDDAAEAKSTELESEGDAAEAKSPVSEDDSAEAKSPESEDDAEVKAKTKKKRARRKSKKDAAPAAPEPELAVDVHDAPTINASPGVDECAPPQPGDIMRGRVGAISESGHMILLNREINRAAARAAIKKARDEKRRVTGLVFGFNRGGFDVMVDGVRVFCPASFIDADLVLSPVEFLGRRFEFMVAPPRKGKRKLVVDRRSIVKREQRKLLKARLRALEVGQTINARVVEIRDFGLFVDLGGITGLVHQSELSWKRNVRPADIAKIGDSVDVKILEIERGKGSKGKKTRVSLSIKALAADPWQENAERLKVGSVQRGEVVKAVEVGAFIRLAPNIDGLLHISELGKDLKHAKQAVNVGDELDVVVDRVDAKQRRISLSKLSKLERKAIDDGSFALPDGKRPLVKPGAHVKVLVDRVESAGVVVQVRGVPGRRGRGFIPNRELGGAAKKDDRRKGFAAGTELEVKIINTDRDGGLRCSVRGLHMDEERRALRKYQRESKKKGFGTLGELFGDKLFGR